VAGKYDARVLVGIGALITVTSALFLADINPSTSAGTLFMPLMLRSVGSVMMFIPLSLATLGDLPKDKVSAGAGFYNLTRQLGSSIGIALITLLLAHYEAVHRAFLVERVTNYNPAALHRLGLLGGAFGHHSGNSVGAHQQALKAVDNIISAQSVLLSFADVFFYVGVIFVISLPLLFFLGKGRSKAAAAAAH
jgi:DHA2 family multidrug resistance protein